MSEFKFTAHLCAYFETDEKTNKPVFKFWGIYSTGPHGLTTHIPDAFYLEHTKTEGASFSEAKQKLEEWVETMYKRFGDREGKKGALWRGMWKDIGEAITRRQEEMGKTLVAQEVTPEKP